jgi:hypothetical protein
VRRADNPVLKSGNLNLLEPSGPLKACNGIALPIYMTISSSSLKGNTQCVIDIVLVALYGLGDNVINILEIDIACR